MKKKFILTFIIIFILTFSYNSKGTMDIEPRELLIDLDKDFLNGNTSKKIVLTNNEQYSVNFTWYLDDPDSSLIRENRTFIPDLSWVDLQPNWQVVEPGESTFFYIYLDIPKNDNHLSEKWEVWATFRQNSSESMFNWEHAVRIYIDIPDEFSYSLNFDSFTFFVFISIIFCFFVIVIFLYKKKKFGS